MNQKIEKAKQILALFIGLAAIAAFSSCEKIAYVPRPVDPNAVWKLSTDVQPIFNANCITCHGSAQTPILAAGKSYNSLTKGGYVSLPAETSRLYLHLNTTSHKPRTTDAEKTKILYWIAQGALNN